MAPPVQKNMINMGATLQKGMKLDLIPETCMHNENEKSNYSSDERDDQEVDVNFKFPAAAVPPQKLSPEP